MRDAPHCPGSASPEARAFFECKCFITEVLPEGTGREPGQGAIAGRVPWRGASPDPAGQFWCHTSKLPQPEARGLGHPTPIAAQRELGAALGGVGSKLVCPCA